MDLKFTEPYLGSITVFTLDPTLAVELEAIGALVEPMDVGAMSSTAGKMAPGVAPSTSARRCKASARPRTHSAATSSCSAPKAMP